MKKTLCTLIAASMVMSAAAVGAESTDVPVLISQETAEISQQHPDKVTYSGTISEIGDGYIFIEEADIRLNYDEDTYICDYDLNPYKELKEGVFVSAIASSAATRSLPPQSYAYFIVVNEDGNPPYPIYAKVASNDGKEILSADGNNRIIVDKDTPVDVYKLKIAVKADEIPEGSEILAFASVVGLSMPAHVVPEKIAVLSLGEEKDEDDEKAEGDADAQSKVEKTDVEKIVVDDEEYDISFDYKESELFGKDSESRIPLRAVCEKLGYKVDWHEADSSISISKDGKDSVTVIIGKELIPGKGSVPVEIDGTTYVTLDLFTVLAGGSCDVTEADGIITVKTDK